MSLAERLRARRTELGLSQGKVARRAEMSNVQYNGYENRRHVPSDPTLERLAAALETDVDSLRATTARRSGAVPDEVRLGTLLADVRKRAAGLLGVDTGAVSVQISVSA